MVRAVWNGAVIAESDDTVAGEGGRCFPRGAVRKHDLAPGEAIRGRVVFRHGVTVEL